MPRHLPKRLVMVYGIVPSSLFVSLDYGENTPRTLWEKADIDIAAVNCYEPKVTWKIK